MQSVTCWFHTVNHPDGKGGIVRGSTVAHDFTDAEVRRLLEWFSNGDWEDGPRCLREIMDRDDGEALEPHRWLPEPSSP